MPDLQPYVAAPIGGLDRAARVAGAAAAHWRLPDPQLIRLGMNGVFAAGDDVVLRVSRPTAPAAMAIWLMERLARTGIRVPAPRRTDVFELDGYSVLATERIHAAGPIDWAEVGAMVARVHRIEPSEIAGRYPLPECGTFPWWQLPPLLAEVDDLLDPGSRRGLAEAIDRHARWIASPVDPVVCHGDVHPGNVLQTFDGPVLLDWDLLCLGAHAWDHAPLMTWHERWGGEPGVYPAFATGYGASLVGDERAEGLATLRLVAATLMRLRAGRSDTAAAAEAAVRLRFWRGDAAAPPWTAS